MNIPSILRHWFTLAATLLTAWLIGLLALSPEQQQELSKALSSLVGPLVVIGTLVVTALWRVALTYLGKILRVGAGEERTGKASGPSGGAVLLVVIGAAVALMGGLPSCSPHYPVTGAVSYFHAPSGAKAGLVIQVAP